MYLERLENRVTQIKSDLESCENNWEAVLFKRIAYVFGLKVNAEAFISMADSFDFKVLQKNQSDGKSVEAILFGQSGFLESNHQDKYPVDLKERYLFLKHKYNLTSINVSQFKYARLRPPNFPTVRLAQLAALYASEPSLFSKINSFKTVADFHAFFSDINTNQYWDNHYSFDKESKRIVRKSISKDLVKLLLINAFVPIFYCYQSLQGENDFSVLLDLMRNISTEKNTIVEQYLKLSFKLDNAMDSQSLIELKNNYCDKKRCLECRIGYQILTV